MTIKNWEIFGQIDGVRTIWRNKKTDERIFIVSNAGYSSWRFGNYKDINKNFNFKDNKKSYYEALIYAKKYMRKH